MTGPASSLPTDIGGSCEPQRILFVDDDRFLLDGLRDALRPHRRRWAMRFVTTGADALAVLEHGAYDVVVSDLRMPGLDGATLLEEVRQRWPSTVRIVLSGQADVTMVARAAAAAHRLVAKPCGIDELASVIERACALRELASRVELDRRAIGASVLPSIPRLYAELTELLTNRTASAADVAGIIEQDMAMAAKVLQLANSAYFGRRTETTKVADAVAYLGTETVRALLLHTDAFRAFPLGSPIPGFDLELIHRRCLRVARLAGEILKDTGGSGETLTAGLLHDVGLLVLASQDPGGLARTLALASEQRRPFHEIERERYGITHAEIGAHLLALWGLPHAVIEAVAAHHDPQWLALPFDETAAVHVATTLNEELESNAVDAENPPDADPDLDYLTRAGLADHRPRWQQLARDVFSQAHG